MASETTSDGTWTYTYDTAGELTAATFASTNASIPNQSITYSYNASGDRTQAILNGATSTYSSNSDNEYTSVTSPDGTTTYTYNANGDLVAVATPSGNTTYTYNSLNQLIGVTTPTDTWTYQYDALGNVIATTHNGQTTDNLVDPTSSGNLVAQFDTSGALVDGYTYGLGLVSQTTPTATNYYDFDALGSTVGLTTAGSSPGTSNVIDSYSYLPFGSLLSSTGTAANPFTYVGQYGVSSDGSGLYSMGARSYDPSIGQFLTNDPSGLSGGDTNFRIYAGNSPLDLIDPSGDESQLPALQVPPSTGPGYGLQLPAISQPFTTSPAEIQQTQQQYQTALETYQSSLKQNSQQLKQYTYIPLSPQATTVPPPPPAFNFPVPLPSTSSTGTGSEPSPSSPGTPSSGSAGSSGASGSSGSSASNGSTGSDGSTNPSNSGVTGIVQSGNTETGGSGGLGSSAGVAGTPGDSGDGGDTGDDGDDGDDGADGDDGSDGADQVGPQNNCCPPPPPNQTKAPQSEDPNSAIGPAGYGTASFVADTSSTVLPYRIDFENSPTATAPAQQVTITDQLDPNLNPNSFQLTGIGWGDFNLSIPAGSQTYQATVPMTYNGETFDVVVSAGINFATDQIYAKFYSIDPTTQLPPDALTGFLPPEDGTGRGEGYISYSVTPNTGLATGTVIRNVAVISFDNQTTISTDQVNDEDPSQGVDPTLQDPITIDSVAPTSSVAALPATTASTQFTVNWSGQDDPGGSGIAYYTIYVSTDGGPYKVWFNRTTFTSATFTAQSGDTYSFISQATDNVGNVEAFHSSADTTISVVSPLSLTSLASVSPDPTNTAVSSVDVTFSEPINTSSLTDGALILTDNDGPNLIDSGVSLVLVSGTTSTYAISGLSELTAAQGLYALTVNAADIQDNNGNFGSGSLTTSWLMDTTPPTSTVSPLPQIGTSLKFTVTVTGTVPTEPVGSPTVDIASFNIYVSINGGAWTFWTTVSPTSGNPNTASAVYTGTSNTVYSFYSTATDNAGNTEPYAPKIEASTDLPDLNTPVTAVATSSSADSNGFFTLNLTGTDAGGSGLAYFDVWVSIDGGTASPISAPIPAGPANSSGTYSAAATYVIPSADFGSSHTYAFSSTGIDAAGLQESPHTTPDVTFSDLTFVQPSQLQVAGLTVENGAVERSFIRYLAIDFNEASSTLSTIVSNSSSDITLTQNNLNNNGTPVSVSLSSSVLTVTNNVIQIDFGANGLGGSPNTTTANGYYTLTVTVPGQSPTVLHFYRLLGDVNGDGSVTQTDLTEIAAARGESSTAIASTILQTSTAIATQINGLSPHLLPLNADVNGDGSVTTLDLGLATASKGQALNPSLLGTLSTDAIPAAMIAGQPGSSFVATPAGGFNLVAAIMSAEEDGNTSDTIDVPTGDYAVPDLVIESLNMRRAPQDADDYRRGHEPGTDRR